MSLSVDGPASGPDMVVKHEVELHTRRLTKRLKYKQR